MTERIRRVVDYIDLNLEKDLSLTALSDIGCLSKFHFSRVFSLYTGVAPLAFIRHKRLEKAQHLLTSSDLPIQRIAEVVGFGTISNFNVAFKASTGLAPRVYRAKSKSKNEIDKSKNKKDSQPEIVQSSPISNFVRRIVEMNVSEAVLPDMRVAYVTQKGSYLDTVDLWRRLMEWTIPRNLFPPTCQYFGISYDEPETLDEEKTTDACVVLPQGFETSDDTVRYKTVKGGTFLLFSFYDSVDRLGLVYKQVVTDYLPGSQYELDERDFLEFIMNDSSRDPEGKIRINLYIPIKLRPGV